MEFNIKNLELNETQSKILDKYVCTHCKLLIYKREVETEEKIIDYLMQDISYNTEVNKLHLDDKEKIANIRRTIVYNPATDKRPELYKTILRYSIIKSEYNRLIEEEEQIIKEFEATYEDVVKNVFVSAYIDSMISTIRSKTEFDSRFAESMNNQFIGTGVVDKMVMNNCPIREITQAAIEYILYSFMSEEKTTK